MWARFTVLNETPIASAIAGCVIPLSRSNTIWMRSRCAAGIFHRSAVFSSRICFLVHLTIRPPESDSQSESYPAPSRDPKKRQKSLDSNSYGSGITQTGNDEPVSIPREAVCRQCLSGAVICERACQNPTLSQSRDHQTIRSSQRIRSLTQALDRRANHRMAQSLSPSRQGLGKSQPQRSRVPETCLHPPHATKAL